MTRTAAILVTGARGAGKTTAILRLLAQRAADARWAVLLNDFGETSLHTTIAAGAGRVVVREVIGCICCSATVSLRAAIVSLLRASAPHRLLIEASAAAYPDAIARLLCERGLVEAVDLRKTVCVVDPRQLDAAAYVRSEVYRAQIAAADLVWLSGRNATPVERVAARTTLGAIGAAPVLDDATHEPAASVLSL